MVDSKGPSKTKLVTDLDAAYKKLNLTLEKTKDLSASIYGNLQGLTGGGGGGGGGGASSMSGSNLPSFITPQQVMGSGSGGGISSSGSAFRSAAATMAGGLITAATSAVSSNDYIMNSSMTNSYGFFAGIGAQGNASQRNRQGAANAFQSMSEMGTPTSSLDAANAAMLGNSSGLMAGLGNYSTIAKSAASVSNIMPGTGLEGGMGAVASLNQGSSVNKLRMIGINVRDQNGMMRDIESIARDLWKNLMNTKSGKGKITVQDLSFSLQSGNSIDMMLNQYFGNDAVLRQAIISYLYQFAQEGGTALSYTSDAGKAALIKSGASSEIAQSAAARSAAGYKVTNAYTASGVGGVMNANSQITSLSNTLASNGVGAGFAGVASYAETISGAGNGGGAAVISTAIKATEELTKKLGLLGTSLAFVAGAAALIGASNINTGGVSGQDFFAGIGKGSGASGSGTSDSNPYTRGRTMATTGNYTTSEMKFSGGKGASKSEIIWAETLLKKLKIAPNQDNVAALVSWKRNEGAGGKNNPLNSTFNVKGSKSSTSFNNPAGVQDYSSEASGIAATALNLQTVKGVGYDKILQDLSSGSRDQILTDVANSQWSGNSHYGGGSMVHINLPNVTKITDAELQKTVKSIMDQINSLGNIRVK
jgi:hypothetical protein